MAPADHIIPILDCFPSPVMLVDVPKKHILFINQPFTLATGYAHEDIESGGLWFARAHPDPVLRAQVRDLWWKSLHKRRPDKKVLPVVCKSLSTRIFEFNVAFLPDDLAMITLIDVTARNQLQTALQDSEARFRSVFEQASAGIALLSPMGVIQSINPMLCSITGFSEEELIGKSLHHIIHSEETSIHLINLDRLRTEPDFKAELDRRLITRDNTVVWTRMTATMTFDSSGNPDYIVCVFSDLTECRKTELELEKTQAILAAAFEQSPTGILILDAPDGRVRYANKAAFEIRGQTDKIPTLHPQEEHPDAWLAFRPDGDPLAPDELPALRSLYRGEICRNMEVGIPRVDGSLRWVLVNSAPFKGANGEIMGSVAVFPDITDIKDAEKAKKENEERYQAIFENIMDGYYRADANGLITLVNPSAVRMLGYASQRELLGRNLTDLLHTPPDQSDIKSSLYTRGWVSGVQMRVKRKDGSIIEVEGNSKLIHDVDTGETLGFEGVFRDITEHKRTQELLIQTEKMMSVGGLAAGMAHEINNPLGIILQAAQSVERRISPEIGGNRKAAKKLDVDLEKLRDYLRERGVLDYVRGIREAGERAAAIVRNMLNFSRQSDSGKIRTDLNQLVEKTIALASNDYDLKKRFDFRHIQMDKQLDPALPEVKCNPTEIEQVLLNLLRNAAQAVGNPDKQSRPGVIGIRTGFNARKNRVVVEVADNGPGLTEEELKRAMEPFYTTKDPGKGTGLGLSVSYFIVVRNHGGDFRLESPPDGGVRAVMEIPPDPQPAN